ncbi:MAG: O-antigen ligase family protein [Rhodospirillaceae bacterium]|nr:O-antigen ligase family protein [Rhodospirillales bacterium]
MGKNVAFLTTLAFVLSMLVPVLYPDQDSLLGVPFAVLILIWAMPLMLALMRGEPWAFVIALALLMFLTDASFRTRSWADKSVDAQVLFKGAVWVGCGLVGVIRMSRAGWLLARPPALFGLLFICLLFVSALWSPLPSYTMVSALAYALMFLFGLAAAEVLDERRLLYALALGAGLIVLPSLAIAPFAMGLTPPSPGSTGTADRLRGLTDHPIPLAEIGVLFTFAVAMLWHQARSFGPRLGLAILVVMGAVTVYLTQSRTPPLAMIAAALAFLAYRRGGGLLLVPTVTLCLGSVFLVESMGGLANVLPGDVLEVFSRSGSSKEVLTFSGRMDIWSNVIDHISRAPVLGYGHAAGMALFKSFVRWKITHAHNMYLQSLLYTGVIGFTLLMGVFLCQLRMFAAHPSPVRDILVLYILLKGLTEQSVLSNLPSGTVAVWMVTVGMAAMAWRRQAAAATSIDTDAGTAPALPASTAPFRGYGDRSHGR